MQKIVVILGPTGVGKTETSIHFAEKFKGEIINADSRQLYKELVIGTSFPTEKQFRKIPHALFGATNLADRWDAARFREEAGKHIDAILLRKNIPFVVGGTGLYIRALLFGIFEGVKTSPILRQELEKRMETKGLQSLYLELQKVDPKAAKKIHPNDPSRILRALEVYKATGVPISDYQKDHGFHDIKYNYLKIGINRNRKQLYERIEGRVDEMVALGLEAEVKSLREKLGGDPLLLRSIGYKEWFPYFEGKQKREEVIGLIKQNSRNFAKRQLTWFRKETDISWFEAEDISGMENRIKQFLPCNS